MDKKELCDKLMGYGFYDDSGKYVVCLDKKFLQDLFPEANEFIFEETEHK